MRTGSRLGPYEILTPLGAGGMGEVYRARDTRLGREVAVKVLPAAFASDPERLRRFEQEARATAALNHPNILAIFDIGAHEGQPYTVAELLQGETLRERLRGGALPVGKAVELATQIAQGLAAAHEMGIVHRDLKPENLFVTRDGHVKILDFGIAKLTRPEPREEETQVVTTPVGTEAGVVLGTVGYMAPEQVRGETCDHRADIFALGCVLYEMLTGQRAFGRQTAPETLTAILREPVPEPSQLAPCIPAELDRIVAHCLEKAREERFQSAHDVVFDLRAAATTAPRTRASVIVARPRPRGLWIGLAAALVAGAALLVWHLARPGRREPPGLPGGKSRRIAVLPFENLGVAEDEYFATGVTDEITGRLAGLRGLAVVSRVSAFRYAGTTKSTKEIGEELGVAYLLTGTVRWARGSNKAGHVRITPQLVRVSDDASLWAEVYEFAFDDIFRVQSEIARSVVDRLGLTLLEHESDALEARPTDNLEAYQVYLRGKFAAGQPHFTLASWLAALEDFQRATALDPGFAGAWVELSKAHSRLIYYRYDISSERRHQARQALERARGLAPGTAAVHLASGYYNLWVERDPMVALAELEAASAAQPSNAEILDAKGELYRMRGDWDQALEAYRAASSLSPRDAGELIEVAETYWWMRRYPEALAAADRAIVLAPDQAWPHLTKVFTLWSCKGGAGLVEAGAAAELIPKEHEWWIWAWYWQLVLEGKHSEALTLLDATEGAWIRNKVQAAPRTYFAAFVHLWRGDERRAREELETARRLLEAEVAASPEDGRYHSSLGVACAALGRREEAVREGKRGVELLPLSKDAVYGIAHIIDLAHIYTLLGDHEQAIAQLEVLLSRPGWISIPWLEMDPRWGALRGTEGYRSLCTRYTQRR